MKKQSYKKKSKSKKLIFYWLVDFCGETCSLYYLEGSNNVFYCIPSFVSPYYIFNCDFVYLNKFRIGSDLALTLSKCSLFNSLPY